MTYRTITDAWTSGRAYIRAELTALTKSGAGTPYGCEPIKDNTFAAACYDQNGIDDLDLSAKTKLDGSDKADCRDWSLNKYEWAEQIGMAYEAKLWDREQGL